MKPVFSILVFLILSLAPTFSQQSATLGSQNPDRVAIDATLQSYLAANMHKSLPELLAVWPDLEKDKKEYDKTKHHFADPTLSDEQMTVDPLEIKTTSDGAVVRVQRIEKYVKTTTTSSIVLGDLRSSGMPAQDPGPHKSDKKKDIKKSDEVWITMHRAGDNWTIATISGKKPQ